MKTWTPLMMTTAAVLSQGCRMLTPGGGGETAAGGPVSPPAYRAAFATSPIVVDGRLDEAAWDQALPIRSFATFPDLEPPISQTEARILWDDQFLYVGFKALDKDVWSYMTERNDPTCLEDVLEIFFKTDLDREAYYNFEINALGTIYDAFTPRLPSSVAGGTRRWSRWNCEGIQVGVHVHGTLNNHEDVDEGWDLEVAIPFAALHTLKGQAPAPGDVWAFHLARYDYSVYLPGIGREITTCAPLTGRTFHDGHESWMRLVFEK